MQKKSSKSIILVGYRSSNGNLVPICYFENNDAFVSWFNDNKIITGNLIFFKLRVPFYGDLDEYEKTNLVDFIKNPYI